MKQFSVIYSGNGIYEVAKKILADLRADGFSGTIERSEKSVILNVYKIYKSRIVMCREANSVKVMISHENVIARESKRLVKQPVKFIADVLVDWFKSTSDPNRMATSFYEDEILLCKLKTCVIKCFREN